MSRGTSRNRRSSLPKSPRPSRAGCLLTLVCPVSCLNHRSPATIATTCLHWLARTSLSRSPNSTRDFAGSLLLIVQRCRLSARNRRRSSSQRFSQEISCLLYTSDAADDLLCVDLGGRRIIKKKKKI